MGSTLTGTTPAATYQSLVKFGNNSTIGANAQYLSDGLGNNLPLAVSTTALGLSNTLPYKLLSIKTSTSTEGMEVRTTSGNTGIRFSIADTSVFTDNYNKGAIYYLNTGASSAIGTMIFALNNTTDNSNVSTANERMRITPSGSILIGTTTETARLQVKGSGSTSGTTSLLVQNSSSVNKIFCNDDSTSLNLLSGTAGNTAASVSIGAIATGTLYLENQVDGGGNGARIYTDRQNTNMFFGCVSGTTPTNYSITIGNSTAATGATHNIMFRQSNAVVGGFPNTANATYPSAQFFVESTTRGFLPPRMTDAQVRAIATPAAGLMCFNTDLDCPVFYSTLGWRKISHSAM